MFKSACNWMVEFAKGEDDFKDGFSIEDEYWRKNYDNYHLYCERYAERNPVDELQ